MTLSRELFFTFTDSEGKEHKLPEKQPVATHAKVKIVCDGPRCIASVDNPFPVVYEWEEDAAVQDPTAVIPHGVFRLISAEFVRGEGPKTFCGRRCLTDYMNSEYVAPLSPGEQEEQRMRNELVDVKKSVHLVDSESE